MMEPLVEANIRNSDEIEDLQAKVAVLQNQLDKFTLKL